MGHRGHLTEEIDRKATELLGVKINQVELRLLPYVQFELMNNRHIERHKVNAQERELLEQWRTRGWIQGGERGSLSCTKEFWDAMNEILWLGYVDHGN